MSTLSLPSQEDVQCGQAHYTRSISLLGIKRHVFSRSKHGIHGVQPLYHTVLGLLLFLIGCLGTVSVYAASYDFSPRQFDKHSIHIDNPWFPLKPGTQYVYEGSTSEDGKKIPHKIITTVTDLTKEINGVNSVIVFEKDYSQGNMVEAEIVFFAQDKDGNVWHLGQYTEEHDKGELIGGRAWFVGYLDGARAGIMMLAHPEPGMHYEQGFAPPPFNWTDRARVASRGKTIRTPYGNMKDVLVIDEYSLSEQQAKQIKYYAPHLGNIAVGWQGKDKLKEILELISVKTLDDQGLASAREEALTLEKRAYVYGKTPPAKINTVL